jgi:hypothetical protein
MDSYALEVINGKHKKRGWLNDPFCKLCSNHLETPKQLCKDCSYTEEAWDIILLWFSLMSLMNLDHLGFIYRHIGRKQDARSREKIGKNLMEQPFLTSHGSGNP